MRVSRMRRVGAGPAVGVTVAVARRVPRLARGVDAVRATGSATGLLLLAGWQPTRPALAGGGLAAGQCVQLGGRDAFAPAKIEAIARRQRVEHDAADHER